MKLQNISIRNKLPLLKKKKKVDNYRRKFRAQFGRRPVLKAVSILREKKKKYDCPSCSYLLKVKRISTAIFKCSKCNIEFTSDSFSFTS